MMDEHKAYLEAKKAYDDARVRRFRQNIQAEPYKFIDYQKLYEDLQAAEKAFTNKVREILTEAVYETLEDIISDHVHGQYY